MIMPLSWNYKGIKKVENKIKEARLRAGLSRSDMHRAMGIPVRTIEDWEAGRRKCPAWAETLIVEKLIQLGREQ